MEDAMVKKVILSIAWVALIMVNCGCGSVGRALSGRQNAAVRHVIVYREPGRFGGWPANGGV